MLLCSVFIVAINKSQGQTFGRVGVSLPKPIFALGQLHVAISTTRDNNGLKFFVTGAAIHEKRAEDNSTFTEKY